LPGNSGAVRTRQESMASPETNFVKFFLVLSVNEKINGSNNQIQDDVID